MMAAELGFGPVVEATGTFAAGLPCQAYPRGGPSCEDSWAFLDDERWFARINEFRWWPVLVENVPDMLNPAGRNPAGRDSTDEIAGGLAASGLRGRYTLLSVTRHDTPPLYERPNPSCPPCVTVSGSGRPSRR